MPSRSSTSSPGSLSGRKLGGKYEVLELIGSGAMGEVYAAHHATLDKRVAVKVVLPGIHTDPLIVGRFKSEARAASRLDHPNSVQVLDFGEEPDGLLYIAMELLRGQTLRDVLRRSRRLSERRTCHMMQQVLSALSAAHTNNIIHRDLKPANIMLVRGHDGAPGSNDFVKVCDFGIAKLLDPTDSEEPTGMATLTRAGAVVGTPSYMSPEQAAGKRVDARSDIFSCGVIMYRALTGNKPFKAETVMGLLTQVLMHEPPPISKVLPTIDSRLDAVVQKAMAKKPEERFQSARDMRGALLEIIEGPERTLAHASLSGVGATAIIAPRASSGVTAGPGASHAGVGHVSGSGSGASHSGAAPMQSLGGSLGGSLGAGSGTWARSGTYVLPAAPTRSARMWWPLILLVVVLLGAGGWFAYKSRFAPGSASELSKFISAGSWGQGEDYALGHYDDFVDDELAKSLVVDGMRIRREKSVENDDVGIDFDPSYQLSPSVWSGTVKHRGATVDDELTLRIDKVGRGTLEGVIDLPEHGIRAAVRGYWNGNHLMFWDYEVVHGGELRQQKYQLYDKKSLFIDGDRMVGYDGPYRARWDVKRARQ